MQSPTRALLCAAALASASAAVHADLVSAADTPWQPQASSQMAWLAADLAQGPAGNELATSAAALEGDSLEARKVALASRALALPAAAPPSLWTFVTTVQAQQRGDTFLQLGTQLNLVQQTSVPTQVPLPGPLWLLVMGVLGLVGTRLNRSRGSQAAPQAVSPALRPA
jgi:hypothetical protein